MSFDKIFDLTAGVCVFFLCNIHDPGNATVFILIHYYVNQEYNSGTIWTIWTILAILSILGTLPQMRGAVRNVFV